MNFGDILIIAMCILSIIASVLFIQVGIVTNKALDDAKIYADIDNDITIAIVDNNVSTEEVKEVIRSECASKEFKLSSTKDCIAFEYQKFIKIDVR